MFGSIHKTWKAWSEWEVFLSEVSDSTRVHKADVSPKATTCTLLPHQEIWAFFYKKYFEKGRSLYAISIFPGHGAIYLFGHCKVSAWKQVIVCRNRGDVGITEPIDWVWALCGGDTFWKVRLWALCVIYPSGWTMVQMWWCLGNASKWGGCTRFSRVHVVLCPEDTVLQE